MTGPWEHSKAEGSEQWHLGGRGKGRFRAEERQAKAEFGQALEAEPRHTVLRPQEGLEPPRQGTGWECSLRSASPSAQCGRRAGGAGALRVQAVCSYRVSWRPEPLPRGQADYRYQSHDPPGLGA